MRLNYAQRADVLYIVLTETASPCVYLEVEPGIVCRVDEEREMVVGITVANFNERAKAGLDIPMLVSGISAGNLLRTAH